MTELGVLGVPSQWESQTRLLAYLSSGKSHPSLVLVGGDKVSKLLMAKGMARFLFCRSESKNQTGPCGQCSPCRRIEKEIHPDVLILKEEDEEALKVESIRSLCHQMEIAPIEGPFKICIMEECHRLSTTSANALLKTLEEPRPQRHFWLLTNQTGALLPTLMSRCLVFSLKPSAPENGPLENEWRNHIHTVLKTGNLPEFLKHLDDKEKCQALVKTLQTDIRASALSEAIESPMVDYLRGFSLYRLLSMFDDTLQLENRLRSNASAPLMVEGLIRRWMNEGLSHAR